MAKVLQKTSAYKFADMALLTFGCYNPNRMIDIATMEILSCPLDPDTSLQPSEIVQVGETVDSGKLTCSKCNAEYRIAAGIPDLFPGDNICNLVGEEEYSKWANALEAFTEWRKKTWSAPILSKAARTTTNKLKEAFFNLAHLEEGVVLDVGGAGGMVRKYLPPGSSYIGLDPLPIPDGVRYFPFVRGVGEFMPFRNGIFDSVLILESLDHLIAPARFISEAARVLKPGGKLYISQSISQPESKKSTFEKLKNLAGYLIKGQFKDIAEKAKMEIVSRLKVNPELSHTHRFTDESLKGLVSKEFEIVSVGHHSSSIFIVSTKT